jgi:hypothetical protein
VQLEAQPLTDVGVHDATFHADLAFLDEEMQEQAISLRFAEPRFEEQAAGAEIPDAGNVAIRMAFPIHPHAIGNKNARHAPAGRSWRRYEHETPTKALSLTKQASSGRGRKKTCTLKRSVAQGF